MREKTFEDGDIIYREGAIAEHAWEIVSGTVEIVSGADGGRRTVESGAVIGDEAASRKGVFAGTATAKGLTILLPVPASQIAGHSKNQAAEAPTAEAADAKPARRRRSAPADSRRNLPAVRPATPEAPAATIERPRLKTGFFARLFGTDTEPGFARLEVRVASFAGDDGEEQARALAQALGGRKGLNPRAMKRQIWAEGDYLLAARQDLAARLRGWLNGTGADVLIWSGPEDLAGDDGEGRRFLHLVARAPEDPEAAGDGDGLFPIPLAAFEDEAGMSLLHTMVLALGVGVGADIAKRRTCARDLPVALEEAVRGLETAGRDTKPLVEAALGRGFAALASLDRRADTLTTARTHLDAAQAGLAKAGQGELLPLLEKDRAAVMQSLAERTNDAELLAESVPVLEAALASLPRDAFPLYWAGLQHRLGVARFRLDFEAGDVDALREALTAFQAALGVFSREATPMKWAETMSHLAQVAQVLGEQQRNPEALASAAEACRQVLQVHTKRKRPLHWAAAQNNLGTALFLLGKLTRRIDALEGAAEAFELAAALYRSRGAERRAALAERNLQHSRRLLATYLPPEPEDEVDPWEAQFDVVAGGRASA